MPKFENFFVHNKKDHMIKKHLLACLVMFLITVTVRMFIANLTRSTENNPKKLEVKAEPTHKDEASTPLSFAHETIPSGDKKVTYRMNKILKDHKFAKLQTTKLHHKAAKWFPIIEPILKKHGIPEDFKYIPLVESGLKSGTSPKGASGYWQFMPGTGRNYGLKINDRVDERQNMVKSTEAACKYLNSMFSELKSWTLVAAAYNLGDVKLKKQMNRQSQKNYFKMRLNRETATYVYKLISMKEIIEKPVKYVYKESPRLFAKTQIQSRSIYIDPFTGKNASRSAPFLN